MVQNDSEKESKDKGWSIGFSLEDNPELANLAGSIDQVLERLRKSKWFTRRFGTGKSRVQKWAKKTKRTKKLYLGLQLHPKFTKYIIYNKDKDSLPVVKFAAFPKEQPATYTQKIKFSHVNISIDDDDTTILKPIFYCNSLVYDPETKRDKEQEEGFSFFGDAVVIEEPKETLLTNQATKEAERKRLLEWEAEFITEGNHPRRKRKLEKKEEKKEEKTQGELMSKLRKNLKRKTVDGNKSKSSDDRRKRLLNGPEEEEPEKAEAREKFWRDQLNDLAESWGPEVD